MNYMKFSKLLLTVILFLITLITLKKNSDLRNKFYDEVYNSSFNFAYVNSLYTKFLGEPMPFLNETTNMVFNEKLVYDNIDDYMDGAVLTVGSNYLVPVLDEGIVIFVGEKENYGKCVIIENSLGVDILYGNLSNINVSMYDYVKEGSLVGEVNNKLYMTFTKDGESISYDTYLK